MESHRLKSASWEGISKFSSIIGGSSYMETFYIILCWHGIEGFLMEFPGELRMAINKMTGIWELVFMMFWFFGHRSFQVPIIQFFRHMKIQRNCRDRPGWHGNHIMRARHLMSQFVDNHRLSVPRKLPKKSIFLKEMFKRENPPVSNNVQKKIREWSPL